MRLKRTLTKPISWLKMVFFLIPTIPIVLFLKHFDKIMCGDLKPDLQEKIEMAETAFQSKIKIESIPCESRYIYVRLKEAKYNLCFIDSLHALLWDKTIKKGWPQLIVFDKQGMFMFSHESNNIIHRQAGF